MRADTANTQDGHQHGELVDDGGGALQAAAGGAAEHLPDPEGGWSGRGGPHELFRGGGRQDHGRGASGLVKWGEKDPKTDFLVSRK